MSDTIKMLHIDDSQVTSELDKAGFRKVGISLQTAKDYSSALKVVEGGEIDVVTINLDSSAIAPIQTIEALRYQFAELAIIGTSVRSNTQTKKKAFEKGVNLFIEQPIPRTIFIEKIKELLKQKVRKNDRVDFFGYGIFKIGTTTQELQISEISPTGVLAHGSIAMIEGIEFHLVLPGYKQPIKLKGNAVRKIPASDTDPERTAIQFTEISDDNKKKLEKYVYKIKNDRELRYYI